MILHSYCHQQYSAAAVQRRGYFGCWPIRGSGRVAGVAIATDIANLFSCVVMLLLLFRREGLRESGFACSFQCVKIILKVGVPAALQGAVFCFANLFVTAAVNSFGEFATSGSTISVNYEYITYYVIAAFSQAATTFISQNSAAGNAVRCRNVLKYCLVFGVLFNVVLTIPLVLFSRFFASVFSSESQVIEIATLRMRMILSLEFLCAVYEVLAGALRGRKYSLQPAVIAMVGVCAVRVLWILAFFPRIHTLPALFVIFPATWVITDTLMVITYRLLLRPSSHNYDKASL